MRSPRRRCSRRAHDRQERHDPGRLPTGDRVATFAESIEAAADLRERTTRGYGAVMEHVRLGRTGLQVSRLCLGTMTFGYQCDEPTSVAILNAACDAGITFLDTADVYPLGGAARNGRSYRGASSDGGWPAGARRRRARDEMRRTHGPPAMAPRCESAPHPRCDRRLATAARHRLHRLVPDAQLRSECVAGRNPRRRSINSCATARCATSDARTISRRSSHVGSAAVRRSASPGTTPCNLATTCSIATSNGNCFRCASTTASQ